MVMIAFEYIGTTPRDRAARSEVLMLSRFPEWARQQDTASNSENIQTICPTQREPIDIQVVRSDNELCVEIEAFLVNLLQSCRCFSA